MVEMELNKIVIDERLFKQQILRRIACDGEFRERYYIRSQSLCLLEVFDDLFGIAVKVTDCAVDLRYGYS